MLSSSRIVGRRCVAAVIACAVLAGVGGCTLLQQGWLALSGKPDEADALVATSGKQDQTALRPLSASRSAVIVEVVFVERPADDPLLGDLLWRDLDQVGPLDLPIREGLKKNGFRIGISGSSPPQTLQTLLGLSSEIRTGDASDDARRLVGRRIALTPGGETELQTSPIQDERILSAWNGESTETTPLANARCLFRLKAQRVQDGWAQLEFTPEVHFGDHRLRQVATDGGWTLKSTQQVSAFSSQRFDLTLNQGEMAVVALNEAAAATEASGAGPAAPNPEQCLGRHFFYGNAEGDKVKRVLIVRVASTGRADGLSQR